MPLPPLEIDLYSDTQTRPTPNMRRAIAEAEVGDEQSSRDPTTLALQERVARLLGHEAAVFLPSGTMCNAIAFRLHIRPGGDEALLHRTSHPIHAEAGGAAALSGAMVQMLDGDGGQFTADALLQALRPRAPKQPRSRLVSIEQTTNLGGGRIWPLGQLRSVLSVARDHGLRTHLDGARLLNAVVASGVSAAEYASAFDTAWIDFTKGLGAPVGACLAGSRELIDEAWRYKHMWGGALRQSGILAAAALYALDHHVERLAEDHRNARRLAEGLADVPGLAVDPETVETNIVLVACDDAPAIVSALAARGVRVGAVDQHTLRFVTHLDVEAAGIERAIAAVHDALGPETGEHDRRSLDRD